MSASVSIAMKGTISGSVREPFWERFHLLEQIGLVLAREVG